MPCWSRNDRAAGFGLFFSHGSGAFFRRRIESPPAIHDLNPRLPAGILGLIAASVTAFGLQVLGHSTPSVLPDVTPWMLPVSLVDLPIFTDPGVKLGRLLVELFTASTLLGVVVFLNTIVGSETVPQVDDKPSATLAQSLHRTRTPVAMFCIRQWAMLALNLLF